MATAMTVNERFLDIETQVSDNRTDIDGLLHRIGWEQDQDKLWRMYEPSGPGIYDSVYIDGLASDLTDAIETVRQNLDTAVTAIHERIDAETAALEAGKLDKNLGADNAGKHLVVQTGGMVAAEDRLFTGIDGTYLAAVNGMLGLNSVVPDRLDSLDTGLETVQDELQTAVQGINTALAGKLDKEYDTSRAGQVVTVSPAGILEPAVSSPLWNSVQQKPFASLNPSHFTVQNDEASVTDRWTAGIQGVQNNLTAETARIDSDNAVQDTQIQNLQNGKLNIPFNITGGNIPVFSQSPAPGIADIGVKPADFVRWTQIQRVPAVWV